MRKIILSTVTMTLIAVSASQALVSQALGSQALGSQALGSQALAAQPQHHARKAPRATTEQFRNARNAVAQPAWQYSGWSAPAGR
ncbi:hypothetical protein ABID59_001677 [Bradyrhizobium sp. S3.3.6]|uniref:DUF680 domain-containing protein n=2 Tax=Bradyrhizobium cytisi TaxID=515489 RepID=A0A5S4WJS1_9BRAD|nr:hypothetical protein FXB38_25595 [Bradyrhizobium cytisi]